MALMYEVTGYDRQTGRLAVSHDVPEQKIALVKKIAGVGSSDDGLGSCPLGPTQIPQIAKALKTEIEQRLAARADPQVEAECAPLFRPTLAVASGVAPDQCPCIVPMSFSTVSTESSRDTYKYSKNI